jgi:hypothetical protein
VTVFLEAAAATTGDAHRAGGGHFTIDFLVQFQNLATKRFGHFWTFMQLGDAPK